MLKFEFGRLFGLRFFCRALMTLSSRTVQLFRLVLSGRLTSKSQIESGSRWFLTGPRMLVTATVAFAFGVAVESYGCPAWWLVSAAAPTSLFLFGTRHRKAALLLLLLPVVGWSYCCLRQPRPDSADLSNYAFGRGVIFTAEVAAVLTSVDPRRTRAVLSCRRMEFPDQRMLSGKTLVTISGSAPPISKGDELKLAASVRVPKSAVFPWDFDYASYLKRQGVFSLCSARSQTVKVIRAAGVCSDKMDYRQIEQRLDKLLSELRARVVGAHRKFLGAPAGELLSSFVLGDRAVKLSDELVEKFRVLGLSHVLAASGFNLTLVTGLTWWIGHFLLKSGLCVNLLCFCSMMLFVGLAGPSPSVVRAALMCTFLLTARCLFRTLHTPAALSLALLITLAGDPCAIADIGLQLSYVATAGIISGARIGDPKSELTRRIRLLGWLRESVTLVLLAQAAVLPIQLAYFWQIGLLFLPANLTVTPIVSFVSVLGFIASTLVILDWRATLTSSIVAVLDRLLAYPIHLILLIVDALSGFESAKLNLGPPEPWTVGIYYACLIALFVSLRARRFRLILSALFLLSLGLLLWRRPSPPLSLYSCKGTVILLSADRQALCLGEVGQSCPTRFLRYFGATVVGQQSANFAITRLSRSAFFIYCRQAKCRICVIDGGAQIESPDISLPVSAIVLTGPSGNTQHADTYQASGGQEFPAGPSQASRDTSSGLDAKRSCLSLPYSDGPPDVNGLVRIVKESGCRWVIVNSEAASFHRQTALLAGKIHELPGVRILRSSRTEFMLVGDGNPIELKQPKRQVNYGNVSNNRNRLSSWRTSEEGWRDSDSD